MSVESPDWMTLKHGPDGSGRDGPCDPDCRKCAGEKTDEPPPRDPPAFCAACHQRAPEEIGYLANVNAKGLRPKFDGWMIAAFPYTSTEGVVSEAKRLCPPCGEKVAKFIAHLSTPMLHEEDLL